jgi:hypothetical protein
MDAKMLVQRVRDRSYLATTSLVYGLLALLLLVFPYGAVAGLPLSLVVSVPTQTWGIMFLVAATVALVGTLRKSSIWQKIALSVAATLSGGVTIIFAWQVLVGGVLAAVPLIVWGYITITHLIMLKYHDPHIIKIIENDISYLKSELATLKRAKD